jgi:acetylornithine/LysW-gamma-L-lysine aminotransferase
LVRYLQLYEDRGIIISRAEGQYVWDDAGRRYLDLHTGHGVAFLGHRNPHVVEAIKQQLDRAIVVPTTFGARVRDEMLEALSKVLPRTFEYVLLLNSGSEAVEFALKVARRATGRARLVSFTGAFHGRTLGALSLASNPRYRKPFEPLLPEVAILPFNDVDAVYRGIDESTAAVIVELVQGEGGVNVAQPEFVKALRERTNEVGALLVFDEVQTGFGRTGRVWAFEHYGVKPDILVAGKAIGGGFPVSMVALPAHVAEKVRPGDHGSTYGGNPLACAAVKASTEVLLRENVPERAARTGATMMNAIRAALEGNRMVRDVRGIGLMIGVELRMLANPVLRCMQDRRVLALKAGATVVRTLPPYLITEDDVLWSVEALAGCIDEELSRKAAAGSA